MKQNMLKQAAIYHKERRRKAKRHKIFSILAAIVVFCTTVILIMPAATMENTLKCGLEEHVHTEECQSAEAEALVCGLEESEGVGHIHDDACYEAVLAAELICTEEDEDHIHSDECYETVTASKLVCTEEEDWTEGHTHSDECYGKTQPAYVCGLEEHIHTDECRQAENEVGEAGEAAEPVEEDNFLQDEDGSLILDENGEPVPADEDVLPILEDEENGNDGNDGNDEFLRDEEGNLILDENGEPVLVDEEGDPISEDEEPESCEFLRDEDGNLVLDENGDPILVDDGAEAEELAEAEEIVYTLNGHYYQTVFHVNYYGELLADDEIAFTAATNEDMESDRDWEYLSLASDSRIIPMGRTEFALTLNGETVDRSEYTVSVEIIPSYESVAFLAVNQGDDTMMLNLTDEEDAAEEPEVMAGFALFELMDGELAGMGYTTVDVESLDLDSYMADAYDEEGNPAYDEAYTVEAEVSGEDFMITAGVDENLTETLDAVVNPTFKVEYYFGETKMYDSERTEEFFTGSDEAENSETSPADYDRVANGKNENYKLAEIWIQYKGETNWNVKKYGENLRFVNTATDDENAIYIKDGATLRYVYEATTGSETEEVMFYDYNIAWYAGNYTAGNLEGINHPGNYDLSNHEGIYWWDSETTERVFVFGGLKALNYDPVAYSVRTSNGLYLNRGNSVNGKAVANKGLVKEQLDENGNIQWSDEIIGPDLFGTAKQEGKHPLTNYNLVFDRVGDTYTLSHVLRSGAVVTTATEPAEHFWPLNGEATHEYFNADYDQKDNGTENNTYFGMHYKVQFTLEAEYKLPLVYTFTGDDDMWAFLTPVENGQPNYAKSQLIADVGGSHGAVKETADLDTLKQPVDRENGGTYQIDVFYLERSAGQSHCNMKFQLPNVTSIQPASGDSSASLKVQKKVEGAADPNAEYSFQLTLSKNLLYGYEKRDAKGAVSGGGKIQTGDTFTLKANEYLVIYNIGKNVAYTIKETDSRNAKSVKINDVEDDDYEITGNINGATTVVFTNVFSDHYTLNLYKTAGQSGGTEIFKTEEPSTSDGGLRGAEFALYDYATDEKVEDLFPAKDPAAGMKPATRDLEFNKTYYLVETKAPNGYNLLAKKIYFKVVQNKNNEYSYYVWTEGQTESEVEPSKLLDGVLPLNVFNYGGYVLPSTGGPGATLYTLGGVLFMLAAAFLMYKNLRKRGCAVD